MGKFEDEIKKKLQEGQVDYNPSHWDQLSSILPAGPALSSFEQKIQDTLANGESSSTPNWDDFSNNLNSLDPFEKSLKEKLNSRESDVPSNSWEEFSDKLADSNLSNFEKGIKSTLNAGKLEYNHAHWKAFEKLLNGNATKKSFFRAAAAIALLFGLSYAVYDNIEPSKTIVNSTPQKENKISDHINKEYPESLKSIDEENSKPKNSSNPIQKAEEINSLKKRFKTLNSVYKPTENNSFGEKLVNSSINEIDAAAEESEKFEKVVNQKNAKKKNIFKINKKVELCAAVEFINSVKAPKKRKALEYQVHPGAALRLNIWQNPALTGLYNQNNISGFYTNNWEFVDENHDKNGEINLVQPLVYLGAYERRLKHGLSIGGSYKYELKKNWNNKEFSGYVSYAKTLAKDLSLRIGGATTYRNNNLAVNRLTVREQAQNSEYINETDLGELKSKHQYSFSSHLGLFINHPNFYLGYTLFNAASKNITNENEVTPIKHSSLAGVHSPQVFKINLSALFKYEKELFQSYSPGIGITYDNKFFATAELENLNRPKLSLGYNIRNSFRFHATVARQNLEDYQKELNLDNFIERQGYFSTGINWNF